MMPREIIPNATTPGARERRRPEPAATEQEADELGDDPERGTEHPASERPARRQEDGEREHDTSSAGHHRQAPLGKRARGQDGHGYTRSR